MLPSYWRLICSISHKWGFISFRAQIYQQVSISSFTVLLLLSGSLYPPVLSYVLLFLTWLCQLTCICPYSSKHVVFMHDSTCLLDATSKMLNDGLFSRSASHLFSLSSFERKQLVEDKMVLKMQEHHKSESPSLIHTNPASPPYAHNKFSAILCSQFKKQHDLTMYAT